MSARLFEMYETRSELEQAAVDYARVRERNDKMRYLLQDRVAEQRAWLRLKKAADMLLSVYTETREETQ